MSYINFSSVKFNYESEDGTIYQVFEDLNLSIEAGEFVAVLGHNGSGKSTLAKLTNGLLLPNEGSVSVAGILTSQEDRRLELLQQVGMVFQNPDNQIVATIVEEDVAFGPENLGIEPCEIRRRVDDALRTVGMEKYRHAQPSNLSGGQKQRVAIAGILAMNTKCIVLDEATAMLDPVGRREVMSTVKRLNKELGITVIFITHFMDEACLADRVLVMNSGKIELDGSPEQVFSNPSKLRQIGLDVPQTVELLQLLGSNKVAIDTLKCADILEELIK